MGNQYDTVWLFGGERLMLLTHALRARKKGLTLNYRAAYTSTSALTTYSFTASDIGTAAVGRLIVVCAGGTSGASPVQLSSCTIGGVSATVYSAGLSAHANGQASAFINSGTTATISITFSAAMTGATIQVYAIYGAISATPVASNIVYSAASATPSLSLNCPAGAAVIASVVTGATVASATWAAPAIEDSDVSIGTRIRTSASFVSKQVSSPTTLTCTLNAAANSTIAAQSWL